MCNFPFGKTGLVLLLEYNWPFALSHEPQKVLQERGEREREREREGGPPPGRVCSVVHERLTAMAEEADKRKQHFPHTWAGKLHIRCSGCDKSGREPKLTQRDGKCFLFPNFRISPGLPLCVHYIKAPLTLRISQNAVFFGTDRERASDAHITHIG